MHDVIVMKVYEYLVVDIQSHVKNFPKDSEGPEELVEYIIENPFFKMSISCIRPNLE